MRDLAVSVGANASPPFRCMENAPSPPVPSLCPLPDSPSAHDPPAIPDFFDKIVRENGDRPALVCKAEDNLRWNYREYDEQADAVARGLYSLGLRKVGTDDPRKVPTCISQ